MSRRTPPTTVARTIPIKLTTGPPSPPEVRVREVDADEISERSEESQSICHDIKIKRLSKTFAEHLEREEKAKVTTVGVEESAAVATEHQIEPTTSEVVFVNPEAKESTDHIVDHGERVAITAVGIITETTAPDAQYSEEEHSEAVADPQSPRQDAAKHDPVKPPASTSPPAPLVPPVRGESPVLPECGMETSTTSVVTLIENVDPDAEESTPPSTVPAAAISLQKTCDVPPLPGVESPLPSPKPQDEEEIVLSDSSEEGFADRAISFDAYDLNQEIQQEMLLETIEEEDEDNESHLSPRSATQASGLNVTIPEEHLRRSGTPEPEEGLAINTLPIPVLSESASAPEFVQDSKESSILPDEAVKSQSLEDGAIEIPVVMSESSISQGLITHLDVDLEGNSIVLETSPEPESTAEEINIVFENLAPDDEEKAVAAGRTVVPNSLNPKNAVHKRPCEVQEDDEAFSEADVVVVGLAEAEQDKSERSASKVETSEPVNEEGQVQVSTEVRDEDKEQPIQSAERTAEATAALESLEMDVQPVRSAQVKTASEEKAEEVPLRPVQRSIPPESTESESLNVNNAGEHENIEWSNNSIYTPPTTQEKAPGSSEITRDHEKVQEAPQSTAAKVEQVEQVRTEKTTPTFDEKAPVTSKEEPEENQRSSVIEVHKTPIQDKPQVEHPEKTTPVTAAAAPIKNESRSQRRSSERVSERDSSAAQAIDIDKELRDTEDDTALTTTSSEYVSARQDATFLHRDATSTTEDLTLHTARESLGHDDTTIAELDSAHSLTPTPRRHGSLLGSTDESSSAGSSKMPDLVVKKKQIDGPDDDIKVDVEEVRVKLRKKPEQNPSTVEHRSEVVVERDSSEREQEQEQLKQRAPLQKAASNSLSREEALSRASIQETRLLQRLATQSPITDDEYQRAKAELEGRSLSSRGQNADNEAPDGRQGGKHVLQPQQSPGQLSPASRTGSAIHTDLREVNHDLAHSPKAIPQGRDENFSPKTLSRIHNLNVVFENGSVSEGGEVIHHHPVFVKDTSKYWYKPNISREDAISMLRDKSPGTFVVRDSNSFPGAFGLALKVAHPPVGVAPGDGTELVRHFLIEPSPKGVKLKGCNNEPVFGTLAALVYQHSITPMALPCRLILPEFDPAATPEHLNAAQALLEQGAACNVTYMYSMDTESLTGPEAVRRAVFQALDQFARGTIRAVNVHFKVSAQGITLTDNTRSLFFRRHYPTSSVIFAGMDPEDRKWDNNNVAMLPPTYVRKARVFAFVARKVASRADNACHVFAELDPEQPATAVVNFITKVMMGQGPGQGQRARTLPPK